jgi:hypothetical protein
MRLRRGPGYDAPCETRAQAVLDSDQGHLGAASLAAFPEMVSQSRGPDSVLTGVLQDRPALFSVLHEIENLALELSRYAVPTRESPETGEARSPRSPLPSRRR